MKCSFDNFIAVQGVKFSNGLFFVHKTYVDNEKKHGGIEDNPSEKVT